MWTLSRAHDSPLQVGSLRTGTISVRALQLSKLMLDVLRGDDVEIILSLDENENSDAEAFEKKQRGRPSEFSARANDFLDVCACVVNNSSELPVLELSPAN